jgi:hypothetical protein
MKPLSASKLRARFSKSSLSLAEATSLANFPSVTSLVAFWRRHDILERLVADVLDMLDLELIGRVRHHACGHETFRDPPHRQGFFPDLLRAGRISTPFTAAGVSTCISKGAPGGLSPGGGPAVERLNL